MIESFTVETVAGDAGFMLFAARVNCPLATAGGADERAMMVPYQCQSAFWSRAR